MTTEQKHEIEIPGLLEKGYRAVAYRNCKPGEYWLNDRNGAINISEAFTGLALIVEKIQPRRIALE